MAVCLHHKQVSGTLVRLETVPCHAQCRLCHTKLQGRIGEVCNHKALESQGRSCEAEQDGQAPGVTTHLISCAVRLHHFAGHVRLNRMDKRSQMACLKECGRLLGLGCSVLFFPEGTRTRDGKMAAFKKVGSSSALS